MAKVKSPLLSLEAHGELGGVEYRQGIYGPMVGRRSIASMQATPLQLLHRSRLKLAHTAWLALSDTDRSLWCAHATYPATGLNCFLSRYVKFLMAGISPLTIPLPDSHILPITNIRSGFEYDPYPPIYLYWDVQLTGTDYIFAYVYETSSGRANTSPNKMRFHSKIQSPVNSIYIRTNTAYHNTHIRLDQISSSNGDLIGSHLFKIVSLTV